MVALGEDEKPRVLAGDPRRGEWGLLYVKPLHRTGTYNMFIIKKKKLKLCNQFKREVRTLNMLSIGTDPFVIYFHPAP